MPDRSFRPRPGRFGIMPVVVSSQIIGGTDLNSNPKFYIPTPPGRLIVLRASVYTVTVPVDASTCTAKLVKYDASTTSEVDLTNTIDLEALTASQRSDLVFPTTTTEAQRRLDTGDTIRIVVASSATQSTNPVGMSFTVELGYAQ